MSWELISIGCLIFLFFGVAKYFMKKGIKYNKITLSDEFSKELAKEIGKAVSVEMKETRSVLKELLNEIKKLSLYGPSRKSLGRQGQEDIVIDESVIPSNVDLDVQVTNLEGATSEKKVIDNKLEKSKNKLAGLLNRSRKKE